MTHPLKLLLFGCALVLGGCQRLDTLAVIDSPDRKAVIIDALAGSDRVICVRADVTNGCSKASAEAVVSSVGKPADVDASWAGANRVTVTVAEGRLTKAATSALNKHIKIEYR